MVADFSGRQDEVAADIGELAIPYALDVSKDEEIDAFEKWLDEKFGGLLATPQAAAYITSKGAVVMMTKTAALEYAARNIRVNAIGPGITRTPWIDQLYDSLVDMLAQQVPQKRIGEASEMANVAAFLASDEAGHVSGQVWVIDGARSAG